MIEGSFMKALFFGVIAEDVIFPYPELPEGERRRTHELVEAVDELLGDVDSVRIDTEGEIPREVLNELADLGLFGLKIPEAYGGLGLSTTGYARVIQAVAEHDASVAALLSAHEAGLSAILMFGTDEQKERLLPRLATGAATAAFALSEESSGSDSGMMRTFAEIADDGDAYRVTGTKRWVTNGRDASILTVFARTSRVGEGSKPRMTALVVERDSAVKTVARVETLGICGVPIVDLELDGVEVPVENVLAEPGKGFGVAMEVLTNARLGLCASAVGQGRALTNLAIERARDRRSFGRAIAEFPIVKDKIARMMSDGYAMASMTFLTTGLVDQRVEDYSLESAICRVACAEALWRIVDESLAVAAGSGYVKPFTFERRLRDARATYVVESTNEILRCFIALAGMQGPGKRLEGVVASIREPVKGFGLLREFAVRKVKEAIRRERMTRAHPALSRETVIFEDATEELATSVERSLREHGKEISEMQYVQMRVANVAIDLYALAACISRTTGSIERHGEEGARREIDITRMFASAAQARIQRNLTQCEHNDDELRKVIASRAYVDQVYPFDVI